MRFDNYCSRRARQGDDRLAAIQEVWETFNSNLRNIYIPYEALTVDENSMGIVARFSNEHTCQQNQGNTVLSFFGSERHDLLWSEI